MKLRVDLDLCAGHGRCYEIAPELFGEDEAGHCVLLVETVPPALTDRARRAADNCPESAIGIE